MAVFVLKTEYISVNGVDLSDHLRSASLAYSAETQDATAMGSQTRKRIGGLKDWSIDAEFLQDHASGSVSDTLYPLVGSSTFTVIIRPTTAAAGSSNPQFSGTGYLESMPPIDGAVGQLVMTRVRILANGDLSRTT